MFFNKKANSKFKELIRKEKLPGHIAFIMDGNGRWAKKRGLPRTAGHHEGGKALLNVLKNCNDLNIHAITVYAFSTENWKRPEDEVNFLMKLPSKYITTYLPDIKKENIRMNFIGQIDELPNELKDNIKTAIEETKDNKGLIFTIALNYGAQDEIIDVVKKIAIQTIDRKIEPDGITKSYFESQLMTSNLPPVDLMVRTSGEIRISNFLLWQLAYSELYFTNKYWPDFNEEELYKAIYEFQKRNRRFGALEGE